MTSTAWLAGRLDDAAVQVVDASWWMEPEGRDARADFAAAHIPGAVFFDIDAVADLSSGLPHMLPDDAAFAAAAEGLGLRDDARVVVYDSVGVRSAARVWWSLRVMGHGDVVVLDGGLPKWIDEGRPVEARAPAPRPGRFRARRNTALVRDADAVERALATKAAQVVDARPALRFLGEAREPRAGLRAGHMPGALNLPAARVLALDGTLLPADALRAVFAAAGVDLDRPIVTSCGSGVTACMLALALARLGRWDAAVYDGAWAEWGRPSARPVATGA